MAKETKFVNPFAVNAEYTQSPLVLPFQDIASVWWRESEIHRHIPVFSIDSLLRKTGEYPLTLAGIGGHAIVFRLKSDERNVTVKIFYPYPNMIKDYIEEVSESNPSALMELVDEGIDLQLRYPDDRPLRQIAGHSIGNKLYPQNIDPPLCIWVKKNKRQGIYVPIGYSTPFVNGNAIKIDEDRRVKTLAHTIEKNCRLYLGNKNDSENAIIEQNGSIKFIDVEIRPEN